MKMKEISLDGLTGESLAFAKQLNAVFADLPEGVSSGDLQSAINKAFEESTGEKGCFKVAMDAAVKSITDDTVEGSLGYIVKQQGILINQLKEQGASGAPTKSLIDVMELAKDTFKANTKNKSGAVELEYNYNPATKAAAVTAISTGGSVSNNITTATGLRLGDGPLFEIKRGRPFILDAVNVGQTTSSFLIWWDELAKQGNFAVTAEGVLKPMIQYEFSRKSADYKKTAAYMVLTDEFMNDLPQLVTNIRRLVEIDMMNQLNADILTDMIAALPVFTYSGLNATVYHADDYAAIAAAICQIQSFFFFPTVLVLNPADQWKMRLTKDDVGRYQMPPFVVNGATYEFGQVIVDPRVAIGHFLIGDGSTFNVDFKGGIITRIGYNQDDIIKNQQTLVVEQYYYDYISTNRLNAWVYGNFSVIKGLINDTTNS